MQARELKPGQWFEVRGELALCVGRGEAYSYYVKAGCERVILGGLGMKVELVDIPADCDDPWRWVKPEPEKKWRPFRPDELCVQLGKSVRNGYGDMFIISAVSGGQVLVGVDWIAADNLLAFYTFLKSDERCGVLE